MLVRRRFKPEFIEEIQALLREALNLSQDDPLPDIFRVPVAVPLKIGIIQDLRSRYGLRDPKHPRCKLLTRALKRYSSASQYHYAILSAKTRFDMSLKPAQPITDEDRRTAHLKLERRRKRPEPTKSGATHSSDGPSFSRASTMVRLKDTREQSFGGTGLKAATGHSASAQK